MGKLFIPAEQKIEGPWLISQKDLENLDQTLNSIYEKLSSALKIEVGLHPEDFKIKPELERTVILSSKSKTRLIDSSLIGIIKDQKVNDLEPKELYIEIGKRYSGFAFLLSVTSKKDGTLDYSVECLNQEIKDEIKYEIDKWIEDLRPSKINQIWSNYLPTLLILFGIFWFLYLISALVDSPADNYKNELKQQAEALISKGIDSTNMSNAIEILLKLEVKYEPQNEKIKNDVQPQKLRLLLISTLCFIMLLITPKTTIGLGKYKRRLEFYRFWKKIVLISVPSLFILPKIYSIINEWLYR